MYVAGFGAAMGTLPVSADREAVGIDDASFGVPSASCGCPVPQLLGGACCKRMRTTPEADGARVGWKRP